MACDEFELRNAARDLGKLFHALNAAKYADEKPRGERTMRPAPGPRTPAPIILISLDADATGRIFEMARDAADHVQPTAILHHHGARLCEWIAYHANPISELDFADDFLEEIHHQAHRISKRLNPPGVDEVARRPEPRQLGKVIVQRLATQGHATSTRLLRLWAHRSATDTTAPQITSITNKDGKATYLMSEVEAYMKHKQN